MSPRPYLQPQVLLDWTQVDSVGRGPKKCSLQVSASCNTEQSLEARVGMEGDGMKANGGLVGTQV